MKAEGIPAQSPLTHTVRALFMQAPISNLTVIVIAILYFFLLQDRVDRLLLGIWTITMAVTACLRLTLWYLFRRNGHLRSDHFWLHSYAAASVCVGCAWGSIQLFLGDMSDQLLVIALFMLNFGVLSAAVSILAYHLPAFVGYCLPQITVLIIALLRSGDSARLVLIAAVLFYLGMLTLFARNEHRRFLDSSRVTMENERLVERLHQENSQRETIIQQRTEKLEHTNALLEEQIAERKRAESALRAQTKSLEEMAHHDALTGLPNRLLLTDRLSQSIIRARRNPSLCAVLFIDLDHFKQINDSLGHSAGDALLKAVAARLLGLVRQEDTVARLGGDEFILVIGGLSDLESLHVSAQKILDSFSTPFAVEDNSFSITASIGLCLYPKDGDDPETLLRNADSAMYRAKADGRGSYCFYSAEMTEQARRRLAMEADLQVALREHQLELYFQPQVSLHDDTIVGAEALLRWNHPTLGIIMPDSFIHVAEESSLINRLGQWVLEEGCRQLRHWQDRGLNGIVLAVNLSGREFWNNPLVDTIDQLLRESGCSPHALELEITESFLVQRPEQSRDIINALRDKGISIAVDDFGTGYSSLSYLKQYSIDKLKVDQSFVRDIETDRDDQAIVRAVIAMGHSLDMTVIGEGVENEIQAEFLRGEGCDRAQGLLYASPLPSQQFEDFVIAHRRKSAR